ncbi:hypothetical protein K474DRAFT_1671070 [Panus rudis PR-1116 ss-1]|nr:hypothetical protein K474DRAFT_1671070 [Panus rudis PR-1116 ss-1]
MSRQPSPSIHSNNMYGQHLHGPAAPSAPAPKPRLHKGYAPGITAGAEDVKYQQKYKELKKKVKEIELDNDKLYLKLLHAKKNIRRMNLERAILYERLAAVPPTPGRHLQELPPESDPVFAQSQSQATQPPLSEESERAVQDYLRARPNATIIRDHNGRIIAIEDPPIADPFHGNIPPPPPGIPVVAGFKHDSAPGYDRTRDLPPPPPPAAPPSRVAYEEPHLPNNSRSASASSRTIVPPPPLPAGWEHQEHREREHREHRDHRGTSTSNSSNSHHSSHHHHRSHRSRDLDQLQGEPTHAHQHSSSRMEPLPPVHALHSRRSSIPGVGEGIPPPPPLPEGMRSMRSEYHDIPHNRERERDRDRHDRHAYSHPHVQIPPPDMPVSPTSMHSPTNSRGNSRPHGHQRIGPGAHINRETERDPEYERALERGREEERIRERQREEHMRQQMAREAREAREWEMQERALIGPGVAQMGNQGRSRSDTPASGSGSGRDPSRPASGQSYERDRGERNPRYAVGGPSSTHHANLLGLEQEYEFRVASHIRHSDVPAGAMSGGRKRPYEEMDVDEERGLHGRGNVGSGIRSPMEAGGHAGHIGASVGAAGPSSSLALDDSVDDRSVKRVHHHDERPRSPGGMLSSARNDSHPMDEDD